MRKESKYGSRLQMALLGKRLEHKGLSTPINMVLALFPFLHAAYCSSGLSSFLNTALVCAMNCEISFGKAGSSSSERACGRSTFKPVIFPYVWSSAIYVIVLRMLNGSINVTYFLYSASFISRAFAIYASSRKSLLCKSTRTDRSFNCATV